MTKKRMYKFMPKARTEAGAKSKQLSPSDGF